MAELKKQAPAAAKPEPKKEDVKTVKAEPKKEVNPAKSEKKEVKQVKPVKRAKPVPKINPDAIYHISKRTKDRRWQVKAEGAAKALKLFFTQEEAIDYAKSVAGNQEGRIVIHKEDGSFRKLTY